MERPDVLLLDIGMPGASGLDVARNIRAQAWGRGVFNIANSGWATEEDKRKSREAGINLHFAKPMDVEMLAMILSSFTPGIDPMPPAD